MLVKSICQIGPKFSFHASVPMFARHLHTVRVVGVAVSTRHLGRERVDDGALGSVIALATMHQMFESCLHGQKFLGLLVWFVDVLKGQRLDLAAGPPSVMPKTHKLSHRLQ